MPVTATMLGSAAGSGVDLAIPITVSQPAGSVVVVASVAYTGPEAFFESQGYRSVPTDSQAGTWSQAAGVPFIGSISDGAGGVGARIEGSIAGAGRTAGPDLSGGGAGGGGRQPKPGCTTCGSELTGTLLRASSAPGDTVTLHWFTTNTQPPAITLGIVLALEGVRNHVETDDQSQYGNGDSFPGSGGPANVLNWQADLGIGHVPKPTADCAIYTAASAYGTSGFTPANGSTIATVTSGAASLMVSLDPLALAAVRREPGGTFGGAGSILLANYQLVRLL